MAGRERGQRLAGAAGWGVEVCRALGEPVDVLVKGKLVARGQIVTIMDNVATGPTGPTGGFLITVNILNGWWGIPLPPLREAAWTDVSIGAFYAEPVIQAYGWGIAEGTSATTFSPDSPVTRGEFAKMLYRALSLFRFAF